MNPREQVYLPELDSVRNSDMEILEGQSALWREIVRNGHSLGSVVADSGLCGNAVDVFLCEIGSYALKRDYEGIVSVVELSERELRQWIAGGRITDGYTLSACAMLRCH